MANLLENIKRKSQIVVTQINLIISAINDKLDMKTGGTVEKDLTVSGNIIGNLKGNADTATTLQNSKNIAISGAVTGTDTPFDGSDNISIPVTGIDVSKTNSGILAVEYGGTGSSTKNFVDLNSNQTIGGNKTFSDVVTSSTLTVTTTLNIPGGKIWIA